MKGIKVHSLVHPNLQEKKNFNFPINKSAFYIVANAYL